MRYARAYRRHIAVGLLHRRGGVTSALMPDFRPRLGGQRLDRLRHGVVEYFCALAAAHDKQAQVSLARGQPFFRRRQRGNLVTHRVTHRTGGQMFTESIGKSAQHLIGDQCEPLVGHARDRVLLVNQQWRARDPRH